MANFVFTTSSYIFAAGLTVAVMLTFWLVLLRFLVCIEKQIEKTRLEAIRMNKMLETHLHTIEHLIEGRGFRDGI